MIKYKNFEDAALGELKDERKRVQDLLNDVRQNMNFFGRSFGNEARYYSWEQERVQLGRSLKSIEAKIARIESGSLSKEYNIGDYEVGFNALDTLEKMLENALTEVKNYRLDECHAREKREKYETLARNIASAIECVKKLDQD